MVSALGGVAAPNSGYSIPGRQAGGSRTSLDGEIAQCQRQLADLVTCPSSTTPAGKAAMQALSEKLAAARTARNNSPPTAALDIWA